MPVLGGSGGSGGGLGVGGWNRTADRHRYLPLTTAAHYRSPLAANATVFSPPRRFKSVGDDEVKAVLSNKRKLEEIVRLESTQWNR